jgi:hypothetical protein
MVSQSRWPREGISFAAAAALASALIVGLPGTGARGEAAAAACDLRDYKALSGLTATAVPGGIALTWEGDKGQELRLRLAVANGTPGIEELAVRSAGAGWTTVVRNARPDFKVVSGLRRITNQQLDPLAGIGVPITKAIVDKYKWEAFWDAPLNVPGGESAHNNTTPPQRGVLDQPGLPRKADEVHRAAVVYHVEGCSVKTNGQRVEVSFPGVQLGVFSGRLQFTIYRGTNLIRQEIVATTDEPSVAYKYDAGLQGVAIQPSSRLVWRNESNQWDDYRLGSEPNAGPVTLRTSNRLVALEVAGASLAVFPPPHNFFWARETSYNLGYNWYQKDSPASFAFGVRQPEHEVSVEEAGRGGEESSQNFALRSARPGTWQRMPVYLYPRAEDGHATIDAALAYTRGDRFKALPGYQVMATHFHMGLVRQARRSGNLDGQVPDLEVMKAAGITIVAPIDGGSTFAPPPTSGNPPGVDDPKWFKWTRGLGALPEAETQATAAAGGGRGRGGAAGGRGGGDPLKTLADYYETARRHSDKRFLVMPNAEILRGEVSRSLGGHSDLLLSHPVFWVQGRASGQPLVEKHPTYGKVYHVGTTADMMEMARLEGILIYMPHPQSKGSTGFPDAIKDTPHFIDEHYRGIGFRWGMGLDGSEQRLCEYRCLPLLDDMNNWVADKPTPPKYIQAISEFYQQGFGDDIYANNPVNYVKLDEMPGASDWSPIINSMTAGDYFVTSGEVLIPSYAVRGAGARRTIVADVEWTFPLEFVEVVWGDGEKTDRQIIPATDFPALGKHHFEIPFDVANKKWVRFAAWDSAGNGAMVQPIKLTEQPGAARPRAAASGVR